MSFSIATSGLKAITEQLNTVSNNIANSGTVGFKSGRTEFASLYSSGTPLGVGISNIAQSISKNGSISGSASPLDVAIQGSGFFMVRDSSGVNSYTRAGYFHTDSEGNLVNNQGMNVMGYGVDENGTLQPGNLDSLKINSGSIAAKASDSLNFVANLKASDQAPTDGTFDPTNKNSYNYSYPTQVFDSLGREHTMTQYFVKSGENEWQTYYKMDDEMLNGGAAQTLQFSNKGELVSPTAPVNLTKTIPGAADLNLAIDYQGISQNDADFAVSKNNPNGYKPGEKNGQVIEKDGSVYATYSNGERMLQGQIALANFANPNGLSSENGTTWQQTGESGSPLMGSPGSGLYGSLLSNALEGSNVELTDELVGLMTAQRNYQANTKVISTNDSMMNALFQAL